jgi:type IV secretory pathway TrbD component
MTCEEFGRIGWNAERDATVSAEDRAAAFAHAAHCPVCAAMDDSWLAAKVELRTWAAATEAAETPSRVEMRLRQEFRTRHRSLRVRRSAVILSWGLAAAALIFSAVTWINWRNTRSDLHATLSEGASPQTAPRTGADQSLTAADKTDNSAQTLIADRTGDFTPLPGSILLDSDDASIVRVRMQRSSLGALGLPVDEERASDWIQVDLLVTDDGLPQAVRLSR